MVPPQEYSEVCSRFVSKRVNIRLEIRNAEHILSRLGKYSMIGERNVNGTDDAISESESFDFHLVKQEEHTVGRLQCLLACSATGDLVKQEVCHTACWYSSWR